MNIEQFNFYWKRGAFNLKVPTYSGGSINAMDFHRNNFPGNGKIDVIPKVPLTRETLPLAYTLGIAEVSREVAENPGKGL